MGKSILICSQNRDFIDSELTKIKQEFNLNESNLTDLYNLAVSEKKASIGIESIRALNSWLITRPYSAEIKLAIIHDAGKLTLESQNSLLKLLGRTHSVIVVVTPSQKDLFPL
jgi:DNA polymerase III gamma/tau subunit